MCCFGQSKPGFLFPSLNMYGYRDANLGVKYILRTTMAENRTIEGITEDRISDLPRSLIDSILEQMSARDIARTSVLSKKWRYIWATHSKLVLDKHFFDGIKDNIRCRSSEFVRTITNILLVHSGPILKFEVYIPFGQSPDMDLWILTLSRNGIKELTFDNAFSLRYKLPSYIFSCVELTYLKLCNCIILNPPLAFGGFRNLNELFLNKVSLPPNIGTVISSIPVLKKLYLLLCTGVGNIKILAPSLAVFVIVKNHEFEWQWFNNNSNLLVVYVVLGKKVEQRIDFNLLMFLANLPLISTLWLDGFFLKFLAAGTISNCLGIKVYNLTVLKLMTFGFNDMDQISCCLSLLRSSPNLGNLEIEASMVSDDAVEPALNYMEATNQLDEKLNQLVTVKLSYLNGVRTELLFIKLLLAHSPSLKTMVIDYRSGIDVNEELRILKEVMRFPRASTMAEIIST